MGLDFAALTLSWRPNQFLVLPPGFAGRARPHALSPVFAKNPEDVLTALKWVALAEPRTSLLTEDLTTGRLELVQRSRIIRFPDYITIAAVPIAGGTALAIYSRSKYGIGDFGVNRARVERWLSALARVLA